ncbi:hypothetical protein A6X20_07210 [Bradyrhizobium elkanii]|nr:hypothetical protein A6X20_07210 [Bradyrhizobium elkanii]ODM79095.1 hypothetical protein A6452_28795 [Bradyrhizobium elkanii]
MHDSAIDMTQLRTQQMTTQAQTKMDDAAKPAAPTDTKSEADDAAWRAVHAAQEAERKRLTQKWWRRGRS